MGSLEASLPELTRPTPDVLNLIQRPRRTSTSSNSMELRAVAATSTSSPSLCGAADSRCMHTRSTRCLMRLTRVVRSLTSNIAPLMSLGGVRYGGLDNVLEANKGKTSTAVKIRICRQVWGLPASLSPPPPPEKYFTALKTSS